VCDVAPSRISSHASRERDRAFGPVPVDGGRGTEEMEEKLEEGER